MSTITIPRSNVTIEQVSAVLQSGLGSRYEVTASASSHIHHESSGHPDSILVKRHWFEQANVRVVAGTNDTEIQVGGAANFSLGGVLFNRAGTVRKVHQVLEHSTDLAGS